MVNTVKYRKFEGDPIYRKNRSPFLDGVVSVENCFYYMSLLESFYEVEQSMGAELFKLYIVAAERRYLEFVRNCGNNTLQKWDQEQPVPLDIAYAWHAHLLSPYRYMEDICCKKEGIHRRKNDKPVIFLSNLSWKQYFPLKAMHDQRTGKRHSARWYSTAKFFVYPWYLTKAHLERRTFIDHNPKTEIVRIDNLTETFEEQVHRRSALYIHCGFCNDRIYIQNWESYMDFRTDPNVALKCARLDCGKDTTVDTLAVNELLLGLQYDKNIKGRQLDNNGKTRNIPLAETTVLRNLENRVESLRKTDPEKCKSVDRILDTINEEQQRQQQIYYLDKANDSRNASFSGFEETYGYDLRVAKDVVATLRSTYTNNPTPFSTDLIQAMLQQREFISTMVTKISPKWKDHARVEIPSAINDYHDFLLLMKKQKNGKVPLPTWAVDFVWHVHMMHPWRYFSFMNNELGRVINHDNTLDPSKVKEHLTATEESWTNFPPPSSFIQRNLDVTMMKGLARQTFSKPRNEAALNPRVYKQLKDTLINTNVKKRISFKTLEDFSFHNSDDGLQHNIPIHSGYVLRYATLPQTAMKGSNRGFLYATASSERLVSADTGYLKMDDLFRPTDSKEYLNVNINLTTSSTTLLTIITLILN
ncbi:hypothetical protein BDB00DRAFT_924863 [Zychaea mexicana]|uniref:uncharacterized protein n=1 Tax=Zychaea mexicana TaxID=64656 RepID=UPI0022FDDAB4|nr:uncharacterized protein BDB00DRAFT_924863 [Zychaea mexicana]KAI9499098.1 hypothetical protein BDB00DRAFT_924863 [Zychaea mexicana]